MPMYPPPVPTASGSDLTVSMLVKNPKLLIKRIADQHLRKDYLGLIFADNGLNASGSTGYQQVTANDILPNTKSEPVAPGTEYPKIQFSDPTINFAHIQKQGAEFDITEEMETRDQMGIVDQRIGQVVNRVVTDNQILALAVLDAAISAHSRSTAGQSWGTISTTAASAATAAVSVYADLAAATGKPSLDELGYEFDTAIMHPTQWRLLLTIAGKDGIAGVRAMLESFGIKQTWVTNRQTAGKIKFVAAQAVGGREWEGVKGVQTRIKEAGGEGFTDKKVVNVRERVMAYVTDPYAVFELTTLA